MKKIFESKNVYKIIVLFFIIYCISVFVKQQIKLNSYSSETKYYETQKKSLNDKKQQLLETQENVNSPEYIEQMAREKLEMYFPNEIIFIDINN